ncbi:MAG: hypothetical protein LUD07_05510 [Clostridiales bacterium]|nr:hypothetical protein [Clostridiales bacterium]
MKQKRVVIIGAGRSGRGMLGELYDRDGYKITFADIRDELVDGLRRQGYYTVQMTDLEKGGCEERKIENYDVIHVNREKKQYVDLLARTQLISTALLPKDFDSVIGDLAKEIRRRNEIGIQERQFITLGANYVGLYEYFDSHLRELLSDEDQIYFERYIRLVLSIVNRKNLLPEETEQTEDAFRVIGDNKNVLRVEDSDELRKFKGLPSFFHPEENLGAAMAIKIWTGNLVQCSMAFVGLKNGHTDTYAAAYDKNAARYAYYASVEGYRAVAVEYGLEPRDDRRMVTIFRNPEFSDSLYRIVRDPIRKIGRNDRFIGPALCCMRHGILPYYITKCLAYAFFYKNDEDPESVEMQKLIKRHGIEEAIGKYCGLQTDRTEEKVVYDLIYAAYLDIKKEDPFDG